MQECSCQAEQDRLVIWGTEKFKSKAWLTLNLPKLVSSFRGLKDHLFNQFTYGACTMWHMLYGKGRLIESGYVLVTFLYICVCVCGTNVCMYI